jgi:site-specific DNA recombinase
MIKRSNLGLRAVVYARYSSELQSDSSVEDQVRLCRDLIDRQSWAYLHAYTDRAISGASALRAGYQQLLDDARAGRFDVLVAEALDRLTRDQADTAMLYKQLTFLGIKIITFAEGEASELHVALKGTMNALFLKDLAHKTRRGIRGRIEIGRSGGGLCYGYDVISENTAEGKPNTGVRRINESQADVVRQIFRWFALGRSPRRIAFDLNHAGIPAPGGAGWGASTINGNGARGTGILNNELYIGRLVWNRLRYLKDPITGKRVSRLNPESEWIIREVPELRLLDQDLWERVKSRQLELRRRTRPDHDQERGFWAQTRPKYLLSGLLRCGACGGAYTKINANLFGCATARNKGTCNNRVNVRRDAIENIVLDGLKQRLMDPELFRAFVEEFAREFNRLRAAEGNEVERSKSELAAIERRLRKIVDAIADGVPARTLKDELFTLEARQDELRALLARPEPDRTLRRKIAALHEALENEATRDEAMETIRSLIDAIVLVPDRGSLEVEVRGELAAILAYGEGRKKPGRLDRDIAEQIKMVAGVRFVQERTGEALRKLV